MLGLQGVLALLELGAHLGGPEHLLARGLHALHKPDDAVGHRPAHRLASRLGLVALAQAIGLLGLGGLDLAIQLVQQVCTHARLLNAQLVERLELGVDALLQPQHFLARALEVDLELGNALVQQALAQVLAVVLDRAFQRLDRVAITPCLLELLVFLQRRLERVALLAGSHHRLVRGVELAELVDQTIGNLEGLRLVEHEVAQEDVQVAQVLGRLRLVQQAQRPFVVDAQQAPEPFPIAAELRVDVGVGQVVLEAAHVEVGAGEELQLLDVELALEHQVQPLDVGGGVRRALDPEHLRDHDDAAVRVAVGLGDRRPGGAGP